MKDEMWRNDFEFGEVGYESDILFFVSMEASWQ
jgi:hypothetical protein